jgi:hypothetical protein
VETVFLFENEVNEGLAHLMIHADLNITPFLTELDKGMQEQAFLTEQLWLSAPNISRGIIKNIWRENYTMTLQNIQRAVSLLRCVPGSDNTVSILEKIAQSILDRAETKQVMESLFFVQSSAV